MEKRSVRVTGTVVEVREHTALENMVAAAQSVLKDRLDDFDLPFSRPEFELLSLFYPQD